MNDKDSVLVFVLRNDGLTSTFFLPHFDGIKVFDNGVLEIRGGRDRISEIFAPSRWIEVKCLYDEDAEKEKERLFQEYPSS